MNEDQEPVAWRYREAKEDRWRFTRHSPEHWSRPLPFMEPLYLHPSTEIAALRERIAGMEKDAQRLTFVTDKQGIIVSQSGADGVRRYQLYQICEYGTGFILSGKDRWFDTPREAIDAAIAKEPK
ncbi:hypothetical protein AWB71_03268 [Caballeronia peredens]|nr:hypothetical protein AWB71_03268 [Caballeronia peredens]